MLKLPFRLAVAIAIFGSGLPQGLQARVAISGADRGADSGVFAPLELRPNDDIDMVLIPAGSFTMGTDKNIDEKPPHTVYVQSFLIGKTEVTQKQWQYVMGSNPSRFSACGPECPVENVSWNDIQEFIAKLNQKTGQKYRLPSEAEWEYAARAGTTTEWSHGNDDSRLGNYAWYSQNSGSKTQAVGQRLPNAFGLFDMHGNVWEWTQDCWHGTYAGAPADGSSWIAGCSANYRVLRGGSWNYGSADLRSASRGRDGPGDRYLINGFRLARTP
jgi:formylglycine-generating enzyme required for sulfatase activity